MTKAEAYQAMLDGKKIRHENYTPEEFAFINKDGKIELEDGVVAGGKFDEFWTVYQKWEDGWSVVEEPKKEIGISPSPTLGIDKPMRDIGIVAHMDSGKAAMAVAELAATHEPVAVVASKHSQDLSSTLLGSNPNPYINIMQSLPDMSSFAYGEAPAKLKMLRNLNLSPEQYDYFLNAPPQRLEGEKQEDYKTRRMLNKLLLKYRNDL